MAVLCLYVGTRACTRYCPVCRRSFLLAVAPLRVCDIGNNSASWFPSSSSAPAANSFAGHVLRSVECTHRAIVGLGAHFVCVCVTTGHFVSPLCCSSTVVGLSASRCCTNALQIPATPNIPPQKPLNTQPPTTSPQHPAPSHNNHARRAVDLCPKSWLAPARAPGATPRLSTPETRNPQTQPPCRAPICPPLSTTSGTITATCILHADMPWSHHNPITPIASILPSPKSPHSLFTPYHHHLLSVKSKPLSRAHSAS